MAGMRYLIIAAVLGMLALSAGCQREDASTEEAPSASSEAAGDVDGSATVPTLPVMTSLPPEWPDELPMYPGATLTGAQYNTGGPESGCMVWLTTSDSGEAVLEFYRGQTSATDFVEASYVAASDSGAAYFIGEHWSFNAGYRIVEQGTEITLMLIRQLTEDEPAAFPGSSNLPVNFPVDILPPYPGAVILNAENLPMDNLLELRAFDTKAADVLAFYKEHYSNMGLTILRKEIDGVHSMHVFAGDIGGVVLNLSQDPDGSAAIHLMYGRK